MIVALRTVRGDSTHASGATATRIKAIMIDFAAIALRADHVRLTVARSVGSIAVFHSQWIADAVGAILRYDGVAIESRPADVARRTECVVQTLQALAGEAIAAALFARVDVVVTFAWSTRISLFSRIPIVARGTQLAQFTDVAFRTCARYVSAVFGDLAAGGKTVNEERELHIG